MSIIQNKALTLFAIGNIMNLAKMLKGVVEMNSDTRKGKIIKHLEENKVASILEMSKLLNVTRETIRKDIYELEEKGVLIKTRGGAILDKKNEETDYERRKSLQTEEKRKIAEMAYEYIEEGDSIYLDYGTTSYMLAEIINGNKKLTVVTNTIPIINLLVHNENIDLIILGGKVRKNEDSMYGTFALNNLKEIFVDIGFFGCGGIAVNSGVTNFFVGELEVSKAMLKQCTHKILLVDHTKFAQTALNLFGQISDFDTIISDKMKDTKIDKEIKKNKVDIVYSNSIEGE